MIPSTSVVLPIDREIPKEAAVKEREPVREEDEVQSDENPDQVTFTTYLSRLQGSEPAIDGAAMPQQSPDAQKSSPKGIQTPDSTTTAGTEFSMGPAVLDQSKTHMLQPTIVTAEAGAAEPVTAAIPVQTDGQVTAPQTSAPEISVLAQPVQSALPTAQQNVLPDADRAPSLAAAVNGTAGGNANGGAMAGQDGGGDGTGGKPGSGGNLSAQSQMTDPSARNGSDSMVARQADISFQALMSNGRDATPQMTFAPSAAGMDGGTTLTAGTTMSTPDPAGGLMADGGKPVGTSTTFQQPNVAHRGATPAAEQVAVQVSRAVKDGQGEIRIRMNPEEMGRVDVKMEVGEDGRILAVLKAERPETLDILRRDVAGLEKALQDAGLDVDADSFTFDDGDDGQAYAGFDGDAAQGQNGDASGADDEDVSEQASMIPPEIAAAALGEYRAIGVNVTV